MKSSKNHDRLAEHYLLPAALFALNLCAAQLIYALTPAALYPFGCRVALAGGFLFLVAAVILRKRGLLAGAVIFYLALLIGLVSGT